MKALVTGGAGFIGSHLVEQLLSGGWEVTVLDDFSSGRKENLAAVMADKNLRIVNGNILDADTVANSLAEVDACFHLAAVVSNIKSLENPRMVNEVNVSGTINMLEAARKAEVDRFVYASSCAVYGEAQTLPVKEETPLAPRTPYAASKAAAEQYCTAFYRTYGLGVTCLRFANVYGSRRSVGPYSGVIVQFAERLMNDHPPLIYGDGLQTRDFVYSTDVAEASVLAAQNPNSTGMVLNVGTGVATSINDLAALMAKILRKAHLGVVREEPRAGEIKFSQVENSATKRILGFEPRVRLDEGVGNFLKWYAEKDRKTETYHSSAP
ncbi:MAG: NAD-dependent epimerase/dehydratase family protein [Candidatus Bathyarchaeia archaeon]